MKKIVKLPNGCWYWSAHKTPQGYGTFKFRDASGKWVKAVAHRISYELHIGPIPAGLTLDHLCHNKQQCCGGVACQHRACVNPNHLKAVTVAENSKEANGGKTHCINGHPFTDINTYFVYQPDGSIKKRTCRVCQRLRYKTYYPATYERKKAKWAAAKFAAHSTNPPSELLLSPTANGR